MSDIEKNIVPVVETEIVEEETDRVIEGYSKKERDIIEKSRGTRAALIDKIMETNPRGKDLEGLVSLIDSQENSAHKTAATRLKVKEEDNKSTLNANTIALMVEATFKRKQEAIRNGAENRKHEIPKEYVPTDIVDGEMSQIDRTETLNVDDFMTKEKF